MKQTTDKRFRTVVYGIALFFLGVLLMYGIIYKFPTIFQETITTIEKDVTVTDEGIADAVEKVYNSVLVINTYKDGKLYGSGSGFIYKVDKDKSYVVTNNHVIKDGDSFTVTYVDGKEEKASLLGGNEYADTAVLKVDTREGFKELELGSTEKLRVGDTAFTVGAPVDFAYSWSVTRGIISGKERLVEVSVDSTNKPDYVLNVLQTDAAVNAGNSGGPLCNANGEVIGIINAKIYSISTGSNSLLSSQAPVDGIGFAIPIETVIEKSEQIINGEKSGYPYMGISMYNVIDAFSIPQLYKYVENTKLTSGILVLDTEKGSAAENAGIKTGDIITKINDKKVETSAYLRYELYKYKIGDKIEVTFERDGKEKTVTVTLSSKSE